MSCPENCPDPLDVVETDGCLNPINSDCVTYNGDALPCLGIPKGSTLNQALAFLETIFCVSQSTLSNLHNFTCSDLEGCSLGNLGNVTENSLSVNQVLLYNGSTWINQTLIIPNAFSCSDLNSCSINDLGDVSTSSAVSGQTIMFTGTTWIPTSLSIPDAFSCELLNSCSFDNLGNVSVSGAVSGQTVEYNGSNWVNVTKNLDKGRGVAVIVNATGIPPTDGDIASEYVGVLGFESPYNVRMAGDIYINET